MLTDTFLHWFSEPENYIAVQTTLSTLQRLDRPQCALAELRHAPAWALEPFLFRAAGAGDVGARLVDTDLLLAAVLELMEIEVEAEDVPGRRVELYASVRETMRAGLHWNAASGLYGAYGHCIGLPQTGLHRWDLSSAQPLCFGQYDVHLVCSDCGLGLDLWPTIILSSPGDGMEPAGDAAEPVAGDAPEELNIDIDDF